MDRRQFLATAGAGLIAGCQDGSPQGQQPTSTSLPTTEQTTEPTPTATPEPQAPSIDAVSLVSHWENFGDALDKQVDGVGQGAPAWIAYRYKSEVHDGTADVTEQVRVFDESGSRVAIEDSTDDQLVDATGFQSWEYALVFDTSQWDLGEYEAEVLIRDNITGKTSKTASSSFLVNDPLGESAVRLVGIDAPDSVRIGEQYDFSNTFENISARDGSVVSTISARFVPNGDWYKFPDWNIAVTIASGDSNTYDGYINGFSQEGTVELRIDALGETWRVDVIS